MDNRDFAIYEFGKVIDWCPNCEHEVELGYNYKVQRCPVCSIDIMPCSLCEKYFSGEGCYNCPLENKLN